MKTVSIAKWSPIHDPKRNPPVPHDVSPQPLPAHLGLWLDRMLTAPPSSTEKGWPARDQLYRVAVDSLRPAGAGNEADPPAVRSYRPLYERWKEALEPPAPGICQKSIEVEAKSRLLLHAASNATVTEGSILLHHTYGVPYLPGSALKGLVRRRLEALPGPGGVPWADLLLGRVEGSSKAAGEEGDEERAEASWIDFHDALWIPELPKGPRKDRWSPTAVDVVNPHHPDYLAPAGKRALPKDSDSPTPVHRLTIAPGTCFLVVVEAAENLEEWLDWLVNKQLLPALRDEGLGAKTNDGYGRLDGGDRNGTGPGGNGQPPPPQSYRSKVTRDPGSGKLSTRLPDGREAAVEGEAARKLFRELPEEVRERFKKRRRQATLEVEVEPLGRSWQIRKLRVPEEGGGDG